MFLSKRAAVLTAILSTAIVFPATAQLPVPLEEQVVEEVKTVETRWVLANGTRAENYILERLQERGITDKYALAVVLGNIKQESKFNSNICEGGARVNYQHCYSGGYGLIQWTTASRYHGLGNHARANGMDPSSLEAQVENLFAEYQWQRIEHRMRTPGQSVSYYMNSAYSWLGWGIHGNRTHYANQYLNAMAQVEVVVGDTSK